MIKEELVELLKSYKEKKGQLRLKENEKKRTELQIKEIEEAEYQVGMSPVYMEGSKSTNINSKVENIVIDKNTKIEEYKIKIKKLEKEIEVLRLDLEEIDVRLGCLTYLEKEILIDRFVNEMTLEDIGQETYYRIRRQTRTTKTIIRIIENSLQKMSKI